MEKYLVKIQSFTDVVTNSSSELFVINVGDNMTSNIIKETILENAENFWKNGTQLNSEFRNEYSSGNGGDIEIKTVKEFFYGTQLEKGVQEFYTKDEIQNIYRYRNTDFKTLDEYQFVEVDLEYRPNSEDELKLYTFEQLNTWFLLPTSEIYELFKKTYFTKYDSDESIKVSDNDLVIDVDWGRRNSIEMIKSEFNGIKIG